MQSPRQLKKEFLRGENLSTRLKKTESSLTTQEIIEISYDMQAGSYIESLKQADFLKHNQDYTAEIARIISSLDSPQSILEAGVGDGITLSGVLKNLNLSIPSFGFDISWSRIKICQQWFHQNTINNYRLCTGDLLNIPFLDNSIDIVFSSHSIEPNGGFEEAILKELYRVTGNYLILIEPAYEFADNDAKKRMDHYGYCKNLFSIAKSLGYNILKHEIFPFYTNPLNPSAIIIIKKQTDRSAEHNYFACPEFKTPLIEHEHAFYSPEALSLYPKIDQIPCLRIQNRILASQFETSVT